MTLNVYLDVPKEVEHLIFLIRVRNLTAQGIKPISEARIQPLMKPDGIKFNLRVWKIWNGYTEVKVKGKWVKKPIFKFQSIWIYAIAYDPETKTLYYGSWTRSLDPYHNQTTDVIIKVKACHSTEVTAKEVPNIGQTKGPYRTDGPQFFAICLPQGAYRKLTIQAGTPIDIDSYERLYWTDDPDPRNPDAVWYDEGWEKSGTTTIHLDSGYHGTMFGPFSKYYYVTNVDFIEATDGSIAPPGSVGQNSWVIVKKYAPETDEFNTQNGYNTTDWSAPTYRGSTLGALDRGDNGTIHVPVVKAYVLKEISTGYEYVAVTGTDTVMIRFSERIGFTYYEEEMIAVDVGVNWSKAPIDAIKFELDSYNSANSELKGWYKHTGG